MAEARRQARARSSLPRRRPAGALAASTAISRPALRGGVLLGQRLRRAEELGDDLDREHAGDPPLGVDDRRVAASRPGAGRRARRASRRRGRAPGPGACPAAPGRRLRTEVVDSESQPSGRRSESTSRACGTSAPSSFARTSAVAWPDEARAAPPRGRCRRRASAPAASGRGRRRRSPRRSRPPAPSGARPESRTGPGRPPSRRIAIRSPILIASSMSWVTKRIVLRTSAWRRRNSFWRRSRLIGSTAPNGSSISITPGSAASARATPTRCCWPPESCAG